jgi:hypothetical protein
MTVVRRRFVMTRADCWARVVRALDDWPDIPTYRAEHAESHGEDWDVRWWEIRTMVWLAEGLYMCDDCGDIHEDDIRERLGRLKKKKS